MDMVQNLEEKLTELIENELVTRNLELFSMRIFRKGRRWVISLSIDHVHGGITLDECVEWNKRVGDLIETNRLLDDSYLVEVSSPGLDQPLRCERDFRRFLGREVWLEYKDSNQQLQTAVRKLQSVDEGILKFFDGEKNQEWTLPLSEIVNAKPRVMT